MLFDERPRGVDIRFAIRRGGDHDHGRVIDAIKLVPCRETDGAGVGVSNPCVPAPEEGLRDRAGRRVREDEAGPEVDGEVRLQLRGQCRVAGLQNHHGGNFTTSAKIVCESSQGSSSSNAWSSPGETVRATVCVCVLCSMDGGGERAGIGSLRRP